MEKKEELRELFEIWLKQMPVPNEYNRMYGHHFTSFGAGYNACLDSKDKEIATLTAKLKAVEEVIKFIDMWRKEDGDSPIHAASLLDEAIERFKQL